jgi:hypothetical protein
MPSIITRPVNPSSIPPSPLLAKQVAKYRSSWEKESQEVVRAMYARNYYDILLYEFALQLYFERNHNCFDI